MKNPPFVSLVILITTIIVRLVSKPVGNGSVSLPVTDLSRMNILLQQFFGSSLYRHEGLGAILFVHVAELALFPVESIAGSWYALIVLIVSYLNVGANVYYRQLSRGKLIKAYSCCGSYKYFTFLGFLFSLCAFQIYKSKYVTRLGENERLKIFL